jgi:hypothetical protein
MLVITVPNNAKGAALLFVLFISEFLMQYFARIVVNEQL